MKVLLSGLLVMGSLSTFASTSALVCKNGSEITKAEAYNITRAKLEEKLVFDETLDSMELIKQVTQRIEKRSPILALMFSKLYLEVTDDDSLEIGKFVFPPSSKAQVFRICGNPSHEPLLSGVSKKTSKLLIDEVLYNKFNELNKTAVILNEVIQRLNTRVVPETIMGLTQYIEEPLFSGFEPDLQQYVSYLLAKNESSKLHEITDAFDRYLVTNPIKSKREEIIKAYYEAESFEAAQNVLNDQTVKLQHGVEIKLGIKAEDLKPYQLVKMRNDGKPFDEGVFVGAPILSGTFGTAAVLFSGGTAILGSAIVIAPVALAAGITTYGLIANALYERKLLLVGQAYGLVTGRRVSGKVFRKCYRKFSNKMPGISELEYAERIIELSRKNAFGKGKGKFVGVMKMQEIILNSFQ